MNANERLEEDELVYRIVGCAMEKMLNYLRITNLKVGLIINFKHAKPEWKRVVLTEN